MGFKKNTMGYPQEIYHYGLRNPWRDSFDSSGDLFMGDVGQNKIEEINIAPNAQGGLNFGWRLLEGNECFNPSSNCRDNAGDLVDPILTISMEEVIVQLLVDMYTKEVQFQILRVNTYTEISVLEKFVLPQIMEDNGVRSYY